MVKKITAALIFLALSAAMYAGSVNVMTYKGGVVFGEIIGSDDTAIYVKTSDGSAKTVPYDNIKKIFDNDTKKDITSDYKKSSPAAAKVTAVPAASAAKAPTEEPTAVATPVKNEKNEAAKSKKVEATYNGAYETIEGESGTINLRGGDSIFVRTVPKYVGFGVDILRVNVLFSGDNVRLKQLLKPFAINSPASDGYKYDDGTLAVSVSLGGYLYLRPIDCFALGAFYSISPMNQNFSVQRGYRGGGYYDNMYIDMPTTDYGLLVKLIPFSQAVIGGDGVPVETTAMGLNLKFGKESLGTLFGGASICDSATVPQINLTGEGTYLAFEWFISSDRDYMQFVIGYQTSSIGQITADKSYTSIAAGTLQDIEGNIPFNAQALYLTLSVAF